MKKIGIAIVAFFVLTSAVYAAEENKKTYLGKLMDEAVSPIKEFLAPYQQLETIVVTPSRYEESELNVSKNDTVIDGSEIEKSYVRYVPDTLDSRVGIVVRDFLGNGKTAQVDIRGFGDTSVSNTLVLIDGRRTNQIDISGVDWAQIDVNSIERIEITRGGQSVLYGDNATGGVINIITKSGSGKKPGIGFGYTVGSYRYNSYKGYIEGGTDFLDYYGGMSFSSNDGYRTNNDIETSDFNGKITLKPTNILKIRVEGGYHKDWYGLPGSLRPENIAAVGWRGSITPNDRAKTQDAYLMAGPELKYEFSGDNAFLFSGDIITRGRRTSAVYFYSDGSNSEINNHIRTFGLTPKMAFDFDILKMHNRLMAGLDYYWNEDSSLSTNFAGGKDLMVIQKETTGLYVTDVLDISEALSINGGCRTEWDMFRFDQQAMISSFNKKRPFEYAAEAGINYKYNDKSSVYANYSRSFRLPAIDEWFTAQYKDFFTGAVQGGLNLDLGPQTANNYEVGIKEYSSKYVSAKVDYFLIDTKHEIFFNPLQIDPSNPFSPFIGNSVYDRTMRDGLELETHVYPINNLDCIANYTYEKAFYVGSSFAGNDIPMVPRHKLSSGFSYSFMDCVNFSYLANFVGLRRFINDQQNLAPRLKSYLTHDIKLSYYKHGLEIYGAWYNIFDEKYSAYGTTNAAGTRQAYYPSPGQNFVIGVNYKF